MVTALVCLTVCIVGPSSPPTLYVSPEGNDAWSGRLAEPNRDLSDGPLATLEAARDRLRALRRATTQAAEAPAVCVLTGGTYVRDRPFHLGPEDSRTTFRASPGRTARLVGGRRIAQWQPVAEPAILERLDEAARGKVLQADLKAAGVTDLGEPVGANRLEIFCGGKPMTLARWPNEGFTRIGQVVGGKPIASHGIRGDAVGRFTYEGDRPKRWARESDLRLHGFWFWDWADAYERVRSIDPDRRIIETEPPYHGYGYRPGARFYALNALTELDAPGEWYADRASGTLYFWPPAPIDSAEVLASLVATMIEIRDAHHITIQGLTFEACRGTAVTITGGRDNLVAGCTMRNLGGRGIVITGGTYHGVQSCDICNTGDGGIALEGGDRKTLTPAGHFAVNNHIWNYSRAAWTYRTGVSTGGVGNRIAHNRIHDAPHMALGLSGNEHVIEFNEIHTVCMDTDDAGAFYMGRDWTWRGNVIRYNYFHDIGRFRGNVGVQAIYLDDWASASTVYGNICYRAGRGVLVGGGRDNTIENNIFVECTPAVHIDSRGLGWARDYFSGRINTLTERLAQVPYRQPPWSTRYPQLLTLYQDEPALAKYNRVLRNICVGGRWLDLLDGLTDKIVEVRDNLVGVDPLFADAPRQDFRLRPESPAWKLGFQPIPIERIGLQKDEYRMNPEE